MSQAELLTPSPVSLPPLAYRGVPVVTTEALAREYGCSIKNIRDNFTNNRERFVEGKHFYSLVNGDLAEFRLHTESFGTQISLSRKARSLTLWLERGAARHAKMLNTDRAWDVFEMLEETFFRVARPEADREPAAPGTSSRLSTRKDSERKELTAAINAWVGCAPIHYAGARNIINAHFGVKSVDEMTVAQVREAVALVHQRIAETPKQAALPPARSDKDAARDNWLAAHRDFYSFQNAVSQPRTAFDGETRALKRHYGYATPENTALEVIEYLLALRVYLDGAITSATSVARRLTE